MRFLDLRLIAYGPFTDHRLDLSCGNHGLHIVYGPNEAGKSASLRAISSFLYGIPSNTSDDFIHSYKEMRLGAVIKASSGAEQLFLRRKGRKNTLLDENGNPLPETALHPFLSVLDGKLFEHLYGINHQTLLDGGLEVKNLKGKIGETLFSAGLGAGVNEVLNNLAAEEKELAAPRSVGGITRKLSAYKEAKKEINAHLLPIRDWQEVDKNCQRLRAELDELNNQLLSQAQERSGLERRQRNLPRLALLNKLREDIAALGEVVTLSENYSTEDRQKAVQALEQAQAGIKRLDDQLAGVTDQIKAISLPGLLIENGEKVKTLYRKLDTHQTAATDKDQLVAKRIQKENDARQVLSNLDPDLPFAEAEKLRLTKAELANLRDLCSKFEITHERPQVLGREIKQLSRAVEAIELELKGLPPVADPAQLSDILKNTTRQGDLEQNLGEAKKRQEKAAAEARQALVQLGYDKKDDQGWNDFLATPLPAPESVDRFDDLFRDLDQQQARLEENVAETTAESERLATEIESMRRVGHVVTELELADLRESRDSDWQLIKEGWLDGKTPDVAPETLANNYESEVVAADEASDRLRREAAQVQQLARLEVDREAAAKRRLALREDEKQLVHQRQQLNEDWRGVWSQCKITPKTPQEMRGWLSRAERAVDLVESYFEASRQVAELDTAVTAFSGQFVQVLATYGVDSKDAAGLAELITRAELCQQQIIKLENDREQLNRTLAEQQESLKQKSEQYRQEQARLAEWLQDWRQATKRLPLDQKQASPASVTAVIDGIDDLFGDLNLIKQYSVRIKAIEKNRQKFTEEIAAIVKLVDPALTGKSDEDAIALLFQRLEQAGNDSVKLVELEKQRQKLEQDKISTAETIDKAQTWLNSLCREVGCTDYTALPEIERQWAVLKGLRDEKSRCEEEIINDGGGLALKEVAAELDGVDSDHLKAQIDAFADRLRELNHRKDEKARELYDLEGKLRQMDGNDRAADAAEQASLAGSLVNRAVHRYLRVKLAGSILRRRIEEHRRRSQSPVLTRANDFFRQISLGSFKELTTDFSETDQQILIGIRENGSKVKIEEMSDGTRDQLYLALRLAYLDHELSESNREPMPFVLDDILMNFDDQRALATLKILAELSQKTQIIYFTHHQHLLELAKEAGDDEQVLLHNLG